jgi:hypothetical protein
MSSSRNSALSDNSVISVDVALLTSERQPTDVVLQS